jgi:trehalose 6-phosphate phosphatase
MKQTLANAQEAAKLIHKALEQGKQLALFLDFDGTLAPIVSHPDQAALSAGMRNILEKLAEEIPLTILSGRDRADVQEKAGIPQAIYAGSHGFDIEGPRGLHMQNEGGLAAQPALSQASESLKRRLDMLEGAWVERKKYAIAVHYRQLPDSQLGTLQSIINEVLAQHPELKRGGGKKIYELKPAIDWHKGRALEWLLDHLPLGSAPVLPIFIGDDLTDEDALLAVRENGIGILVGEHGEPTHANFRLKDVAEVEEWLNELYRLLRERNS